MDLSEYEQLKYEVNDKIYQKEKDINKTNRVMRDGEENLQGHAA